MKVCAFTGGRPERFPWGDDESAPACIKLKDEIRSAIEQLIGDGYTHFISGMARGADTYCAEAVLSLREKYNDITLECAIPFEGQASGWSERSRLRWQSIAERADKQTVLLDRYTRFCMNRRNTYMVEQADLVLAVWNGVQSGGTYNTIKIAHRLSVPVKIIGY